MRGAVEFHRDCDDECVAKLARNAEPPGSDELAKLLASELIEERRRPGGRAATTDPFSPSRTRRVCFPEHPCRRKSAAAPGEHLSSPSPPPRVSVMGLWDKLTREFIDIIEWLEPNQNEILAHRFPRSNHETRNGPS